MTSCATDEITRPTGNLNTPGPRPEPDKQGNYDCISQSMKKEQVTEIHSKNIQKIHAPKMRTYSGFASKGRPFVFWTIQVDYKLDIVFGNENASASAYVRNNQVHFWLYEGSGEFVP